MMLPSPQIKLILMLTIIYAEAKKPPGYVEPPKVPDPNPPKYEYGYNIADEKGDGQGKQEQRDGIYALGRYYVQGKQSTQNVQYFADDWGYHPVVEYSSVGPHSRVTSHFALGEEAVKQLRNKENNLPQLQGILENTEKLSQPSAALQPPTQQILGVGQPQVAISEQNQQQLLPVPASTVIASTERTNAYQQQLQSQPLLQQEIVAALQQLSQGTQEQTVQQQLQSQEDQLEQQRLLQAQSQQQALQAQSHQQQVEATQQKQQEIQIVPQQQFVVQPTLPQAQLFIIDEKQPLQLQLLQQEQVQSQIYSQQPQIQAQVITTSQPILQHELELQPILLKHGEPKQNVIFPQEQQFSQGLHLKDEPTKDNTIFKNEVAQQQSLYAQQQQFLVQPERKQQLLIQTNVVTQQPLQQISQDTSVETKQYETAALFENSDSKIVNTQQIIERNEDKNQHDGSIQNIGQFGTKISAVQNAIDTSNQLIEHTKNLVTGQDVLNINEAVLQDYTGSSTPSSIITEYANSQLLAGEAAVNSQVSQSEVRYSTTTSSPVTELNLNEQPIIVADLEESVVQSTTASTEIRKESREEYQSTSATVDDISSFPIDVTPPATVLVTPRPISTNFLAPITAGVQLQNIEPRTKDEKNSAKQNYNVQIQQSIPYYLGKYEYPSTYEKHITFNETSNENSDVQLKATHDIELGKTLLFFPGQSSSKTETHRQPLTEVSNHITVQQVPSTVVHEKFVEIDQQQAQGYQHQVAVQHVDVTASSQLTQKPTEVTKVIHKPYPVRVPYEVPYPVIKQVQVPVTVEKIVEKPIHITKYVEKPVPIPQPYPVEKIVEKPVHIPVQVTKYVDRPYPVEVRVPYPQPYPVEKVVQKIVKQPYPVEVRVPVHVEKIVEKQVPVPQYIEKPVEKVVEKPVPHYVDRPYPVEVKVPIVQPYLVRVEVPKPYPIDANKAIHKPYGVPHISSQSTQVHTYYLPQTATSQSIPVQVYDQTVFNNKQQHHIQKLTSPHVVQIPVQIHSQSGYSNNKEEQHAQQSQQTQTYFYANPYAYAPQISHYLPPKQEIILNNGYLPFKQNSNDYLPPKKDCDQQKVANSQKNFYYTIKPDDYIGLLPPKLNYVRKLRTARSNFDDKSVRMEYGFMPPLIPSLEIDEQGNPIEKGDK